MSSSSEEEGTPMGLSPPPSCLVPSLSQESTISSPSSSISSSSATLATTQLSSVPSKLHLHTSASALSHHHSTNPVPASSAAATRASHGRAVPTGGSAPALSLRKRVRLESDPETPHPSPRSTLSGATSFFSASGQFSSSSPLTSSSSSSSSSSRSAACTAAASAAATTPISLSTSTTTTTSSSSSTSSSTSLSHYLRLDAHQLHQASVAGALELAQDCQRRLRCCLAALRLESTAELCQLIDPSHTPASEHIFAPVTAGCNCHYCGRSVDARQGCRHRRSHMQSTKNSKRSVHTYLKWISLLGPNFPITDTMLQENFWKNLDPTCEFGVRKENGHAKRPGQPVCINPFHYSIINSERVLAMLLQEIDPFLDVVPAIRRAAAVARVPHGDASILLPALIGQLRSAVDDLSWTPSSLAHPPRAPPPSDDGSDAGSDTSDSEPFLHFVAQAWAEDLCALEVRAVLTMSAITPNRPACGVPG